MKSRWMLVVFALAAAVAQTQPGRIIGEVTSIDAASRRVTVRGDAGNTAAISVRANAPVLRVPAGTTDIKSAERISLTDVAVGDRVAAATHETASGLEAGSIIVMSKADVAQRRERESQDWQKRGAWGIVEAVDSSAGAITLKAGQRTLTVQTSPQTEFRRYARDSVRYSDASPSTIAEIKPGDQLRVLGNRAGNSFTAERIVSGSFRQVAATISSVNAETGQLEVKDLATKQTLTVRLNDDSTMKRLTPELAGMLARRLHAGAGRGPQQGGGRGVADRSAVPPPAGAPAGRGNADVNQMLDRLPALSLAELKPGDAIMVSSTEGSPSQLTAIMLLAGVEPLLTASPTATRDLMSGWLSGGGAGGDAGGEAQ